MIDLTAIEYIRRGLTPRKVERAYRSKNKQRDMDQLAAVFNTDVETLMELAKHWPIYGEKVRLV